MATDTCMNKLAGLFTVLNRNIEFKEAPIEFTKHPLACIIMHDVNVKYINRISDVAWAAKGMVVSDMLVNFFKYPSTVMLTIPQPARFAKIADVDWKISDHEECKIDMKIYIEVDTDSVPVAANNLWTVKANNILYDETFSVSEVRRGYLTLLNTEFRGIEHSTYTDLIYKISRRLENAKSTTVENFIWENFKWPNMVVDNIPELVRNAVIKYVECIRRDINHATNTFTMDIRLYVEFNHGIDDHRVRGHSGRYPYAREVKERITTMPTMPKYYENKIKRTSAYEKQIRHISYAREILNDHVKATKVIFNGPATIVFWKDHTKTVVKCSEADTYSKEAAIAIAYFKKSVGDECFHYIMDALTGNKGPEVDLGKFLNPITIQDKNEKSAVSNQDEGMISTVSTKPISFDALSTITQEQLDRIAEYSAYSNAFNKLPEKPEEPEK